MRQKPVLLVLFLASCSASPKGATDGPNSVAAPDPVTPYEAEWERYRSDSALPISVPTAGTVFQTMLRHKLDKLKAHEALYAELLSADDVTAQSQGNFGVGRVYLNLGCELATFAAPAGLSADQQQAWSQQIRMVAGPMITRAGEKLSAAAQMDAGPASERAAAIMANVDADALQSCTRTSSHWAAPDRPPAESMSPESCVASARESVVTLGCLAAVAAACRAGEGDVCQAAGDWAYEHGDPSLALDLWSIGCDQHQDKGACGSRSLIAVSAHHADYANQCKSGDVLGCIKLARVAELDNAAVVPTACTSTRAISDTAGDLGTCTEGDAASCWALVAKQLARAQMPAIEGVGGILGSLIGGAPKPKGRPEYEKGCTNGRALDCLNMAETFEGDKALPWLEKACAGGVGCMDLGVALVELRRDVPRGVQLLVHDCVENSRAASCSHAAGLFMAGKRVPKSGACAAALELQTCTPTNAWECTSVNRLFHP